jgi:hypothetical protein
VRQLSDNVKRSKKQSVRNGEWICKAPIGYKNVTLSTGKKTIEVDVLTAHYVIKMFELYASGLYSLKKIEDEIAKKTKGHGGLRLGAGRPKGSVKETKGRISLPNDLISWFKNDPEAIELARKTMRRHRIA